MLEPISRSQAPGMSAYFEEARGKRNRRSPQQASRAEPAARIALHAASSGRRMSRARYTVMAHHVRPIRTRRDRLSAIT
jgi:hypothetical protein